MVDMMRTASASGTKETPAAEDTLKDSAAIAMALLAVTAFGVFILFLLTRLSLPETQWTRAVFLLNGIEAIVFAAAGFLFGKEVHRNQAKSAEAHAKDAKARAKEAEAKADRKTDEAARGRALAATVLARETTPQKEYVLVNDEFRNVSDSKTNLEAITCVARSLFPDI